MAAPIGNFQFELEKSLQAVKSAGCLGNFKREKSEEVILSKFWLHSKLK